MSTPTLTRTTAEKHATAQHAIHLETLGADAACAADTETATTPVEGTPARVLQKWNSPRINTYRLAAVFFVFVSVGANDASYGPLIPSLEEYYNLSYLIISLIFLAPCVGYAAAAVLTDRLHMLLGQRGNALGGTACRLISYIVLAQHPPYPVTVVVLALTGLGTGLLDAGFNAWVGDMDHANELLGLLHACYGLGATISPLVASAMVNKYHLPWYSFFYVMIGMAFLECTASGTAFWGATKIQFRAQNSISVESGSEGRFREGLKQKPTWIIALFLLFYVGTEVATGGWLVSFMIQVRHAEPFASGITSTGFWLGLTVGRLTLGFITPRLGEKWAVAGYLSAALAMELLFWLVPSFIVSAVMVAFLGFFMGPIFPSAIVALTKLLPKRLHVGTIGFASAFGGGGAAILPFMLGAMAQAKGVQVLQPFIMACIAVQLGLWLMLPSFPKHQHQE